jgi:hypothetical protein
MSFLFSSHALGAEEMESVFLTKFPGNFHVALQNRSCKNVVSYAFFAQLNCKMFHQNSALDNPITINGYGSHHPLLQTRNLGAQYGLSLCTKDKVIKDHNSNLLETPIKDLPARSLKVTALKHEQNSRRSLNSIKLRIVNKIQLAKTTTASDLVP